MKRTAVLIFTAAVLFVLSGCGSSPGPTPSQTPSPTATLPPGQEPVVVVSATGPWPSWYEDGKPVYNPGGPIIEITLKNVSGEPVIYLEAFLQFISSPENLDFFNFDVTASKPLLSGQSASSRQTLIGGGFSDNIYYPLTIRGTLQSDIAFAYTKSVVITSPPE